MAQPINAKDKRIRMLLAVDLSAASTVLISVAKTLAGKTGADVWLLHVAEPEPEFVGFDAGPQTVREQVAEQFRTEHRQLQRLAREFRRFGITTTALVVQGSTVSAIMNQANKLGIDIIVVGARNRTRLARIVLGSVSKGLLKTAKQPILVIPTSPKRAANRRRSGTNAISRER